MISKMRLTSVTRIHTDTGGSWALRYNTLAAISDGKIDSPGRIDSHYRIVMKSFNSAPQLQPFSYVHCIIVLQDHVMAHIFVSVATCFCKGS